MTGTAFAATPGSVYLDAATYGLAPRRTVAAMRRMLTQWERGSGDWRGDWDRCGDEARAYFAALIGAQPTNIALLPAVSVGAGLVASTLRTGDEVLVADDEFTSVLFPLLVAQRERGVIVRAAPFATLAEAIRPTTRLVAFSLVQSQSGKVAPLERIGAAAGASGAQTLVDATQALPFVPLDRSLDNVDYLVCAAYKHLLCPRGTAFLYVRPERQDDLPALYAGWRSADRPYQRYYGGDLTLAPTAARFDVSLAWIAWVGAVESLTLLLQWQQDGTLAGVPRLAQRLAHEVGLPPPGASVVSIPVANAPAASDALRKAGIRASLRAGAVRCSPHVYNSTRHVLATARAIAPFVAT